MHIIRKYSNFFSIANTVLSSRRLNKNQFRSAIFKIFLSLPLVSILTCFHCLPYPLPLVPTRYHCLPSITPGFHVSTHFQVSTCYHWFSYSLPLVSSPLPLISTGSTPRHPFITTLVSPFSAHHMVFGICWELKPWLWD